MNKILRDLLLFLQDFKFLKHFSSFLPHNVPFHHQDFSFTPLIIFFLNSSVRGLKMLDSPVFSFLVSLIPAAVKVVLGHEFYLTGPSKIPVFRAFFFDQVRFCLDHLRLFFQMAKPGSYLDFLASSRQER